MHDPDFLKTLHLGEGKQIRVDSFFFTPLPLQQTRKQNTSQDPSTPPLCCGSKVASLSQEELNDKLDEIQKALGRLQAGSFGYCVICDKEIDLPTL